MFLLMHSQFWQHLPTASFGGIRLCMQQGESGKMMEENVEPGPERKKSLSQRSREFHWMNGLKWFSPRIDI